MISAKGAARALLLLAEGGRIALIVSEQVIAETERALARKAPHALPYYREALRSTNLRVIRDPRAEDVAAHHDICSHQADVPIVVAAMQAEVDVLVTLSRRHFIDGPTVAACSGLRIAPPGDALGWVRECVSER